MDVQKINKKRCRTALKGIFPDINAFSDFKADDPKISGRAIPKFIRFAKKAGLIENQSEKEFLAFIEKNSIDSSESRLQPGFSFEDLMDEITEDSSVNTLISELNVIANQFGMSKVQGSMFSRLKRDFHLNTPAKRYCIRVLCFWLGENKSLSGWNYQRVLNIPRDKFEDLKTEEKEGVRIAFRLEGRGEIIDTEDVTWLKKELAKCVSDLNMYHIDLRKITCFATTVFLNIPKKEGPPGEPRLYDAAVRDCMVIAHQVLNRFYLSERSSQQKALVIAIDAGEFINLDASLEVLLDVQLRDDPVIRLTSFVRLCSRLADNRVIFYKTPKELKTLNGNILTVWYVDCFWTCYYYDFIPCLLEDGMLPTNRNSYVKFKNALHFPSGSNITNFKALSAIHKFPQNDQLILEIAKVCVARRMFRAANLVLSTILASNPHHVVARTFRMSIFMDLAMEQTAVSLFELYFQRAIDEGTAITENCFIEDDEFYCEFGTVYYLAALRLFAILRDLQKKEWAEDRDTTITKLFTCLDNAEKYFRKGMVFSPPGIGNRCNFLLLHIYCFRKMLKADPDIFTPGSPPGDKHHIYETAGTEFIEYLGWTDLPFAATGNSEETNNGFAVEQVNLFLKQIDLLFQLYEDAVLFRISFPFTKFTFASMVFDFSPIITVRLVKRVITWLEQARVEAEKLKKDRIGVFVILSCFGRIQSPAQYVKFIDNTIAEIKVRIGDDLQEDDDFLIHKNKLDGLKLILMSLEAPVEPDILDEENREMLPAD